MKNNNWLGLTHVRQVWAGISVVVASSMFLVGSGNAYASHEKSIGERATHHIQKWGHRNATPFSLNGKSIVLTIENVNAQVPQSYPSQGVVVRDYSRSQVAVKTVGDALALEGAGEYVYRVHRWHTAVEKGTSAIFGNQAYRLEYRFESAAGGEWQQVFDNGDSLGGHFTVAKQGEVEPFAPESTAGKSVALVIDSAISSLPAGTHPTSGVVIQSYNADGTYTGIGFGPATVDHWGTYEYTKVSANTAVEQVVQNTDFFTLPYTMVYSFDSPTSGTWYQNFGFGLIIFGGTFTLFDTE